MPSSPLDNTQESLSQAVSSYEFKKTYEEAQIRSNGYEMVGTFLSGLLDWGLAESIVKKKPATLEDTLQYLEEAQVTKDFLKQKVGKVTCLAEEDPTYTLLPTH